MKHIGFNALVALVLVSQNVLRKVDGCDGDFSVNVAYGKPANQSSTYLGDTWYRETNRFPYIAFLAVDGIKTINFHGNSCSHTDMNQSFPWWEVYLQELYDISSIKIYQRDDANRDSLKGFVVDGMQSDGNYFTINYSGPYSTGVITITLQPKRQFKSIRIRLPKDNAFICLCEVEVFAEVNVALGKSASQSTTYDGSTEEYDNDRSLYNASLAVDGNTNTNFSSASCSQTTPRRNTLSWWKVTLNDPYPVIGLRIYQRTDGSNANWLNGYKLYGQLDNHGYEEIAIPSYQLGIINITLPQVKIFSEIKVELNVTDFRGICLCELQVFADNDECIMGDYACHNHGQCTHTDRGFSCQCTNGYIGHRCETDIDECNTVGSVCHNHGQCTNFNGGFSCQCQHGYTGVTCETDIDECSIGASACHNHGQCTNTGGDFTCQCNKGYTGLRCETDIDECMQAGICQYHGQCSNTDGSFACNCSAGYNGTTCENDIDECTMQDSACHNHGQCSNTEGSFECQCSNGYVGAACETALHEMNADQEQSKTSLLGWIIAGPLCLILLVTNIVTCLRLRRHESFKRKKRNNIPDDKTTAHNVNARDHRAQAKVKEGISAYEFVEDSYMETRKNQSNESENKAMEPYDNLQMETRSKSEYENLTFERESSLKTT